VKTAKKAPASEDSKAENENSSIVSTGGDQPAQPVKTDTAALTSENSTIAIANFAADPVKAGETGKTVATCQRFYPSVGQTLSVPCE